MNKALPEETASPTEGETERPLGWAGASLSQVCEINPAKPSSDDLKPNELVTFVPMPAVDADAGAITSPQERRFSDVRKGFTAFRNRDVIMAKITPCMENGKAAIASGLTNGLGFGSTEFHVLRSTGAVLPEFVYFFIRQGSFRRAAESEMTGSVGQKRVPVAFLRFAEIPLPPLAEQKRIVAKVKELLARVDAARERLARVPAIHKHFRQATLAAACEGRLTEGWREAHPTRPVKESLSAPGPRPGAARLRRGVPEAVETPEVIASLELPESWGAFSVAQLLRAGALLDVKDGNHGANHPKVADFTAAGLPFITAAQVRGFQIDYDGAYKVSGEPLEKLRVGFARPGDAILTHKGSVGRSALNTRECVLTPQTTYYRPDIQIINPGYLVFLFAAPQFYSQLAQVMSQTTRDFVPISEQYRLFLTLPPKEEQSEIVRRIAAFFKLTDAIEKRVAAATARAEKLTQAILAKAFRGELVPTEAELARREGRGYEPATELLERIRGQRAVTAGAGRRQAPRPKIR